MHDKANIEKFLMHTVPAVEADPTISYMVITRHENTGNLSVLFYRGCNDHETVRQTVAALRGRPDRSVADVFFTDKSLAEQIAACATELYQRSVAAAA